MVNLAVLSALLSSPVAILAENCNIAATLEYYGGDGSTLASIGWKNTWSSYDYADDRVKSFGIANSDWRDAECKLYDDVGGNGHVIGTVYLVDGQRNYISPPAASSVKSIRCVGYDCTHT